MKLLILLLLSALTFSCATKKKTKDYSAARTKKQKLLVVKNFKTATELLDRKKYKEAIVHYNKILIDHPTSNVELLVLYNIAYSYEGLGHCGSAANRYRGIVNLATKNKNLRARALYQLSLNYECLGKIRKAIASSVDAFKIRSALSIEVGLAELPARLAALYSQINNKKEALKYLKHTQNGLKKLNRSIKNEKKKIEIISKTYYFMGKPRINTKKIKDFTIYINNFKFLQQYLLRSAEIGHNGWSKKATQELIGNYEHIIDISSNSKKKNLLAEEALATIGELRSKRFPDQIENKYVQNIFKTIEEKEREIRVILSVSKSHTPISEADLQKQKDIQKLRTKNPNPILEKKTQESTKLPKKAL